MALNTYAVEEVLNLHARGIIERADAAVVNALKCESANLNSVRPYDEKRFRNVIRELRSYINWANSEPLLDLPKSHPSPLELEHVGQEESRRIVNRSVRDFAGLFELMIKEVSESETAHAGSGINQFDLVRITALLDQAESLVDFMVNVEPIDRPETFPHQPGVESGSMTSDPQYAV